MRIIHPNLTTPDLLPECKKIFDMANINKHDSVKSIKEKLASVRAHRLYGFNHGFDKFELKHDKYKDCYPVAELRGFTNLRLFVYDKHIVSFVSKDLKDDETYVYQLNIFNVK